ncbi:MAG: hypothetical protein ACLGPL_03335 [Acidobacteriota bacterium]
MEVTFGKDSCQLKGNNYSQGSRVCEDEKCIVCKDGKWRDVDDLLEGAIENRG